MTLSSLTSWIKPGSWGPIFRLNNIVIWLNSAASLSFGLAILTASSRLPLFHLERKFDPVYWVFTDLQIFPAEGFVLITLILWAASLVIRPRRLVRGPIFMLVPLVGSIVAGGISVINSVDAALSMNYFLRWCLLSGLYFYIVNEVHDMRRISWIIAGSILIQAATGMIQVMRGSSIGLILMGERVLASASNNVSMVSVTDGSILRAYGLADHPNILGGVLVCSLLIYSTSFLTSSNINILSISLAVFGLGISGLLVTFSQSAWIAGLIALGWMTWRLARNNHRKALYSLGTLMLAGAIILLPILFSMSPYIMETLIPGSKVSLPAGGGQLAAQRASLNQAANQIFEGHALTGIGLGAFPTALFQSRPDFGYDIEPPHFVLLEAAAETGIFGAMFYLVLIAAPWLGMWLFRKRLVMTIPMIGTSAALLAMSIIACMDYYPWLMAPGLIWQFVLWGLWSNAFMQSMEIIND